MFKGPLTPPKPVLPTAELNKVNDMLVIELTTWPDSGKAVEVGPNSIAPITLCNRIMRRTRRRAPIDRNKTRAGILDRIIRINAISGGGGGSGRGEQHPRLKRFDRADQAGVVTPILL